MPTKATYIKANNTWYLNEGAFDETASLSAGVRAILKGSGDMHSSAFDETYNSLDAIGWHVNDQGYRWWQNPNNQAFGTEWGGGSGNWGVYKQSNTYTTARKYAGKDSLYGVQIFRYPNIGSDSTWGGLSFYPPAASKLRGHTYRFSFDYRGYTGGYWMEVYNNYTVGWGDMGIWLPTPWNASVAPYDTDWEWRRYEHTYTIQDAYLDWVPGSNAPVWNASTQYGNWQPVQYNGYVYRKPSWTGVPTRGVPPDQEYPAIWDWRVPMTAGSFDLYNNIKVGFSYEPQNNRGTHVYLDNIQITDITDNISWNLTANGWESDNLSESTTKIFAKGTAYMGIDRGDGNDRFAVEGSRILDVNGTRVYEQWGGRGLRLTILTESTSAVVFDQVYDVYGDDAAITALANKLATIRDSELWVLTSFDAIGTNTNLDNQMRAMGANLLVNNGSIYSVFTGDGVRHPYAAVGRGQKVIKEDGSNNSDTVYKRKGVIDLRV
jgi:hypothetical protein